MNVTPIFFVVGDDRSLSVVGSGIVSVENGHFNNVLCVPEISCNLLSIYQITHSGEVKTVTFTPHQVVINYFKNPQNVLATRTVDDITSLYKFNNFGSSSFPLVFAAHSDNLRKLWHERFGHLNYCSLQQLCKDNMVTDLSMVSCKDGDGWYPPIALAPMLPQWVRSTCEAAGDLASDPRDQRRTRS